MKDLKEYNSASCEAMQLIVDHMPKSEQAKVALLLEQGYRLKISTIVGLQPDVTLSLVSDLKQELPIYSLLGRAGEVLQ